MTTTELLIFDCDGVLIDSEPVESRVLWQALEAAGAAIPLAEVHRRFAGYSESDAQRICIEELGIAGPASVFAAARDALYREFSRSLTPMPGMESLVRSLPQRKCVASNSTLERLRASLGLFDLWNAFDPHIFSAEMVAAPKPAPDLFHLCAETLNVDPSHCVVVDDSAHGIVGAVAAGMRAIGFVDPADQREGRRAVLSDAGAMLVATGADELARAFATVLGAAPVAYRAPALSEPV
ncbi:HAD family hydrolase [Ciceribacter ferrooxidans]|uniref:HAD family phosphatase n=1 Tax=Ciceribacter ferrooxidans TaxID=2509717 RepID=A0A4Q2TT83_9HYPH|nr:HAD family phosphatase [Ciceribacter ferrooxidans]RYC24028.1 HAD family phosphatase [Ciceribacter ferrooxidans]